MSVVLRDAMTGRAKSLLRPDREIVLSDWCVAETTSAMRKAVRQGVVPEVARAAAEAKLDAWLTRAVPAPFAPDDAARARAMVRTTRTALRAPDALHVAIALRLGADLATLDGTLAEAAREFGVPVRTG